MTQAAAAATRAELVRLDGMGMLIGACSDEAAVVREAALTLVELLTRDADEHGPFEKARGVQVTARAGLPPRRQRPPEGHHLHSNRFASHRHSHPHSIAGPRLPLRRVDAAVGRVGAVALGGADAADAARLGASARADRERRGGHGRRGGGGGGRGGRRRLEKRQRRDPARRRRRRRRRLGGKRAPRHGCAPRRRRRSPPLIARHARKPDGISLGAGGRASPAQFCALRAPHSATPTHTATSHPPSPPSSSSSTPTASPRSAPSGRAARRRRRSRKSGANSTPLAQFCARPDVSLPRRRPFRAVSRAFSKLSLSRLHRPAMLAHGALDAMIDALGADSNGTAAASARPAATRPRSSPPAATAATKKRRPTP